MSVPVWPISLPQRPLADGYSEQPANLIVRSPMEVGPAKVRRRATAGVTKLQMAFHLTPAQLATFRNFLATDIQDRALAFTWAHPVTGVVGTFRIAEQPTYEAIANGLAWRVAVVFEMLP